MKYKNLAMGFIVLLIGMALTSINLWAATNSQQNTENPTPTPTLVYRWPWVDGEARLSRAWHGPDSGMDGIDFTRPSNDDLRTLASANGKLISYCQRYGVASLGVHHGESGQNDYEHLEYTHVESSSVPQWIIDGWNKLNKDVWIVQGQELGNMTTRNVDFTGNCAQTTVVTGVGILHLDVKSRDITIDGWHISRVGNEGEKDCFEKDGQFYCRYDNIRSYTIPINCDANQPFIGSRFCRRTGALIRPGFDQGVPRESIEFFSHPLGSGQEQALGVVMRDSLMHITQAGPFVNPNNPDQISWEVTFLHGAGIRLYDGVNIEITQPVWVSEGDVDEVNRPYFFDTQFASQFFVYEEMANYYDIFNGFRDGSFGPKLNIERKDTALTIFRILNGGDDPTCDLLEESNQNCDNIDWTFGDVNDSTLPAHLAVEWLARQKTIFGEPVVTGTSEMCGDKPCFKPADPIKKAEFTSIAIKAFQTKEVYDDVEIGECLNGYEFPDVNGSPHADYIYDACGLEILEGYVDQNDGIRYFGHDQNIPREQAAKILAGLYQVMVDAGAFDTSPEETQMSRLSGQAKNFSADNDFVASQALIDLRWALLSENECHLYAVNEYKDGMQISNFDFRNMTAQLQEFGPLQTNVDLTSIDLDPVSRRIYGVSSHHNETSKLYRIDPYLGSAILIGEIRHSSGDPYENVGGIDFTEDGSLIAYANAVGVQRRGIITIDPKTGIAETLINLNHKMDALAQHPQTGQLWTASQRKVFVVDDNGDLLQMYMLDIPGFIEAMDFRPDGLLWFSIRHAHAVRLYTMDVETGQIFALDEFDATGVDSVTGLAWPDWCETGYSVIERIGPNGGTISLPKENILLQIPAGALQEDFNFSLTNIDSIIDLPQGMKALGKSFSLTVYGQNGQKLDGFEFEQGNPALVQIGYTDSNVQTISEDTLLLLSWDGVYWQNATCGESDQDTETNILSVPICHSGEFASVGKIARIELYLPVILK